jgi:hypothetical protein
MFGSGGPVRFKLGSADQRTHIRAVSQTGLKPTDPLTLASAALLLAIAMLAGWAPARRASLRADDEQTAPYCLSSGPNRSGDGGGLLTSCRQLGHCSVFAP